MTEDEAKTKVCWQSQAGKVSFNCQGSACMAWRWISKAGTSEDGTANYYTGKWKGYCGAAGKP